MDKKERIDSLYSTKLAFKQSKEIFEIGYNNGYDDGYNEGIKVKPQVEKPVQNTKKVKEEIDKSLKSHEIENFDDVKCYTYLQLEKAFENIMQYMERHDYASTYSWISKLKNQATNNCHKVNRLCHTYDEELIGKFF